MNAPQKRPDFGRFVDAGCLQSRQEPAKNSRQVDAGARGETGDGVGQKFGHFLEHVRIIVGAENGGNRVAKRGSEEFHGNRRIYMKRPWRENLGGKAREEKGKGGKETALAGAFQRAPKAGPKTTLLPRRRELPRELGWWGGMNSTGAFGELAQHGETALKNQGVGSATKQDPHGVENGGQGGIGLGHDDDAVPAEEEGEGLGGAGGVAQTQQQMGQQTKQVGREGTH